MNFFNSVFSDDPDPSQSEPDYEPYNEQQAAPDSDISPSADAAYASDAGAGGGWNFGGLIRTFTAKSESIIETYRRDLHEFGTGLKKEIEVAQGSLETVGHAIDEFGNTVMKGTAQIISQGKDAILAVDLESDSDNSSSSNSHRYSSEKSLNSKRYSRFDAQVRAIQGDANTYSEPGIDDLDEYNKWKSGFSLEGKSEEIESFLRENDAMDSIYKRVVPNTVDHETFWHRYYFKVYKLKKAEDVRARLVKGMAREDEELSWDVDDDEDDDEVEEYVAQAKPEIRINKEDGGENLGKSSNAELQVGGSDTSYVEGTTRSNLEEVKSYSKEESKVEKRENLLPSMEIGNEKGKSVEELKADHEMGDGSKETIKEVGVDKASNLDMDKNTVIKNDSAAESDEKVIVERKPDDGKSSDKSNDSSLVASQHSANEEEDLGWDEIEDLSSIDEKRETQSGSPSKVDLCKRMSATEEEEDLSWDIEDDDDEPAKA